MTRIADQIAIPLEPTARSMEAGRGPALFVGDRKQLLLDDDFIVETATHVRRVMHQPEKHPDNPVVPRGAKGAVARGRFSLFRMNTAGHIPRSASRFPLPVSWPAPSSQKQQSLCRQQEAFPLALASSLDQFRSRQLRSCHAKQTSCVEIYKLLIDRASLPVLTFCLG